jgi:hypothetical protein
MLNPSDNPPEQLHRLQRLKHLIYRHPFAFCCGLWVTLVLLGSFATVGLFNPGSLEQEASKPTPSPATVLESTPQSTAKKDLPLFLFGAVALGCAGGSLFITYALRLATQRRQPSKGLKPVATVRKKRRPSSKRRRPVPRTPKPEGTELTFQTLDRRVATTNEKLTQVTVLPPEESHPLDGGEESLADMLDLRKHQSLASLMRSKYL